MAVNLESLVGNPKNKDLAKKFTSFNNFLDSNIGQTLKLRKAFVSTLYWGAYGGTKAMSAVTSMTGGNKKADPSRLAAKAPSDFFDLNYTEEQSMVQEALKQYALKMREAAEKVDEKFEIPEKLWEEYYALELAYYQVPESLGGMMKEKSTVTNMMMVETLAHGDLGMALALYTSNSVLNALVRWGSDEQQKKLVPGFLAPKPTKASIALNEPTPLFSPYELATTAVSSGSGYTINGLKNMVPLHGIADYFIVIATTKDKGPQAFIVDKKAAGLTITADRGMGLNSAQLGQLKFDNVKVEASALLGEGDGFNYEEYINFSKLGWCALAVGCCQAVLDYVIPYANDRFAFGEPISHRQAVAFIIADIKIEMDAMRILTQRAASRAEQGLPFAKEAYLAHIMCSDKSMPIGSNGVQLLGGHGYVRDFPVQRWYRDLRAVSIAINGVHI
jgi:alkylation response protein AidB-like acyl-CoA dehydrogenase